MNTKPPYAKHLVPLVGLIVGALLLTACSQSGVSPAAIATQDHHNLVTVTTTADAGPGSLREAIALAFPGDHIAFASSLEGQTIQLSSGQLVLNKSLTISGMGDGITISGSDSHRAFTIVGGVTVRLENLIVTRGNAFGSGNSPSLPWGGAIWNSGELTIVNSLVTESEADFGGGIFNDGTLTVKGSTIAYNDALKSGGGIANNGTLNNGRVTLVNSTVSSNRARDNGGGGISSTEGDLELIHSTVAGNSARFFGGIENFQQSSDGSSVVSILNSVVADSVDNHGSVDVGLTSPYGTVTANHSLIETLGGQVAPLDQSNLVGVDPHLGPLTTHEGHTPTHALLEGSPALDGAATGPCTTAPVDGIDQRGVSRPQGAACDMGAYEATVEARPAPVVDVLNIDEAGTVDKVTGLAIISGTMTCSVPGEVALRVEARQEQRQRGLQVTASGNGTATIPCDGVTGWAVSIAGDDGVFTHGRIQVTAQTQGVTPEASSLQDAFLFWSKK